MRISVNKAQNKWQNVYYTSTQMLISTMSMAIGPLPLFYTHPPTGCEPH